MSHPAQVENIQVSEISPNPHNPRTLFDEEPMVILKESIQKLGVLVPVTLYEDEEKETRRYVLLDGERRWRCARELELEEIPAIIVEKPSDTQNILTMFHIHNVREGWQLMPTALKLRKLMDDLDTTNERELNELTKLSISQIRRCKILLTYPRKFQELMLAPTSKRLKADFFIELDRIRRPARNDKLKPWVERGDAECIEILLNKYEEKVIKSVTKFRRLAEIYRACVRKDKIPKFEKEFNRFLETNSMQIDEIQIEGATFAREVKAIKKTARSLYNQIEKYDIEIIASDETTVKELKDLYRLIEKKLKDALLIEAKEEFTRED